MGYMPRGIQDYRGIQERRMQERRYARKEEWKKGGMPLRRGAGKEECRKEGLIQEIRDAGKEGFRR